jgi:hypothetical protein
MSSRARGRVGRPQGEDRHFTLEPHPLETPDLHKLAQVFLRLALARANSEKPHPARPKAQPAGVDGR